MSAVSMASDTHGKFDKNERPDFDTVITDIADYVMDTPVESDEAWETARFCLMDTLGCGFLALNFAQCRKMLGPVVENTVVPGGVRVPGTSFIVDPVKGAFDIGCMVRWLDFNDTWLAAEWGHPSDNLGAILAVADWVGQKRAAENMLPLTMKEVLDAMIRAHEIQGCLALENSFNRVGLDHVILVKIASIAVAMKLLGGTREQVIHALSQGFVDGQSLRTYRHAPNTGSRKSWAAGDATARAVQLCLLTLKGETGYPSALTAPTWGFYDVLFKGNPFRFQRPYSSYVMEHVLFKISFPAEFHSQTAVEAAITLHPHIKDGLEDIEKVVINTHESAIRIISKTGPLHNPADRDHCLQYMTAIGLIFGTLTAEHYEDDVAADPRIDALRDKMQVQEDARYSKDYHNPEKRSIANRLQIFFKDGTCTEEVEVEYPIGHRRRRKEGIPVLREKFEKNIRTQLPEAQCRSISALLNDEKTLLQTPVHRFMEMLIK